MAKNILFGFIAIMLILILISGCAQKYAAPAEKEEQDIKSEKVAEEEEPGEIEEAEEEETEEEEEPKVVEADIVVEPVREPARYEEAEADPLKQEKDNCGCSFRWDPVCSMDGRTYINRCLFQCFGNSLDMIKKNSQCLKKQGPPDIYVDDVEFNYETDKWNAAYCWRQMYRESGIRYCKNIIVDGRVNTEPEPARGNWLDEQHIVMDRQGRKDSHTIKLTTGQQATNEEYDTAFQPLFEQGRYVLSFWARQDISANNDWTVKLTLKDWWDTKPRPPGIKGCYKVWTEINCDEHFFEGKPNNWRHYHYEFDVPIVMEQWDSNQRVSSECEYDWNLIPGGYGIDITAPTIGEAWFDDFVLEKI